MGSVSATVSAQAAPARTADLFAPDLRGLTIGLISTITLVALESLAIATVMPIVAGELGDLALYGWVFTAFFLGSLIGIVLSGGIVDRMPLYRPFAAGLGLFALGLAIAGLAPSMPVLIGARFLQGLGAGALTPTSYVAIGRCMPEPLQPRMLAMLSTAWVVPGVIGPSLAAVVGQLFGWRWVFLGLIPLLVVAGGLALSALRHVPDAAPGADRGAAAPPGDLHRLGAALVAAGGAALLVAGLGATDPRLFVLGVIAGSALLLPAFRWLTPRGTLRLSVGVPAAVLLRGLMTFAFFAADAYVALLLQTWRGTPATLTGVVFTVTTIAWTAGTWWQARHIDRIGPRRFVALGFALVALGGLLTLPVALTGAPPEIMVVTWVLPGLGMGLMYSVATLVVLRGVEQREQGNVTSSLQLSDILGTALGAGVAGAITAAGVRAGPGGLGPALAGVLVLSIGAAVAGVLSSGRVGTFGTPGNGVSAAVD